MMLFAMQATPKYGVTYGHLARVSSEMVRSSFTLFNIADVGLDDEARSTADICCRG